MGLTESDRRRFDYSATLLRDLSRPLVAQVLWTHREGLEKDVRTLLHDSDARIKLYVIRDSLPTRQKLDDILSSYRQRADVAPLLGGLRVMLVPSDFDADRLSDQTWMSQHLLECVSRDVLFGIVFGNLDSRILEVFSSHGGPIGLKYAVLDEISRNGLDHGPTFRERLGYTTTGPIREAIAMLNAAGLIRQLEGAINCIPTVRGRALLDFTRLLLSEARAGDAWSPDALVMCGLLQIPTDRFYPGAVVTAEQALQDPRLAGVLFSATCCHRQFGRDLIEDVDADAPRFWSDLDWQKFEGIPGRPLTLDDFLSS
jgi:hypothetical protein